MLPCLLAAAVSLAGTGALPADEPFEHAGLLPRDVAVYVHVDRGSRLRGELLGKPLGDTLQQAFERSAFREAWSQLASLAGMEQGDLFDRLVGGNATVAVRHAPAAPGGLGGAVGARGEGGADWVALLRVDDGTWAEFLSSIKPRIRRGPGKVVVRELPEQNLLMARLGGMLIVGPGRDAKAGLFAEVIAGWGDATVLRLAQDPGMTAARDLGEGDVGIFLRHDPPLGGATAAVLEVGDDSVSVRHISRFASSPFGASPRPTTLTADIIDRLGEGRVAVVAHPLRLPPGELAGFVRAQLPAGAITPAMQDNLGERLLMLVGERSGPALTRGAERLLTFTLALEVRDAQRALADLDQFMVGFVTMLHELVGEEAPARLSGLRDVPEELPRSVDVSRVGAMLLPDLPESGSLHLYWTVTREQVAAGTSGRESPRGWWLIGTDAADLERARVQLCTAPIAGAVEFDLTGQRGRANGRAVSRHVARLGDVLANLAREQGEPSEPIEMMSRFLADLADAVESCDWSTTIPGQNRIRSTWTLRLRSPSAKMAPHREPECRRP